jgi:hypothetical protein
MDIENYIKNNYKAFNFKIRLFPNEENDFLPFLEQSGKSYKKI